MWYQLAIDAVLTHFKAACAGETFETKPGGAQTPLAALVLKYPGI